MAEKVTNIARNTSYFTIALIIQKVISFVYFTLIARYLGPDDLGKYYFAISFTTIFSIFIDLGLTNVLTREVAKDNSRANELLRTILGIKLPLAVVTWAVTLGIANYFGYSQEVRYLIYLSTICMLLDSFTTTFFAVARGFHNLKFESIASILFQVVVLGTGLVVIKTDRGLVSLMLALNAASIFYFVYSVALLKGKWSISFRPRYDKALIRHVMLISSSFVLYAVFNRFYLFMDTLLLGKLAGDRHVGLYQVAFKIINALQFLPAAFIATLYPAMSTYWQNNREQLSITFERAMNYLIIISIPIGFGIISISDKVVMMFSKGYAEAIIPLCVNMVALIFLFMGYPVGSLLNACDRQKQNTINMGIVTFFSIAMNLVLIPWSLHRFDNAAIGASITVLTTNILMFVLGWRLVPGIIQVRHLKIFKNFMACLVSGVIMAFLAYELKTFSSLLLAIPISGLSYLLLIFIFRVVKKEDMLSILDSFKKKTA